VNFRSEDVILFDGVRAIKEGFHGLDTDFVIRTFSGRMNVETIAKEAKFLYNGSHILSGGDCGGLFVWDIRYSEPIRRLHADRCSVNCILPHGELPYVLSSGIDDEIKMWDLKSERKQLNKIAAYEIPCGERFSERMCYGWINLMESDAKIQLEKVEELKSLGNDLVKAKDYETAFEKYSTALRTARFVSHNEELEERRKCISNLLLTNLALCCNQTGNHEEAIRCCDKVLENGLNVKAAFRKAQAYVALKDTYKARDALRGMEGDPAVNKLLKEIDHQIKADREKERERYKRMFENY